MSIRVCLGKIIPFALHLYYPQQASCHLKGNKVQKYKSLIFFV